MKHVISIKQKNLKTQEEYLLCDQIVDVTHLNDGIEFEYLERKPFNGKVKMRVNRNSCEIQRVAQNKSTLILKEGEKTKGIVESEYGAFELDLFTNVFHMNDKIIAIEYDVCNEVEVIESYRLMAKIKNLV